MIYYALLVSIVALSYVLLLIYILKHWRSTSPSSEIEKENISFSVIIPVRNEAENIAACLQSILHNEEIEEINPQIIVVDDHSTDDTLQIVRALKSKYIIALELKDVMLGQGVNAYKKMAINYGHLKASGNYIIQLDGDVTVGKNYLRTIKAFIEKNAGDFIAAPVVISEHDSFLARFQGLDMAGMMALTKSGIETGHWYMANGANMIYKKDAIRFNPNEMASGDDVFGIQQVASQKENKIRFLDDHNAFVFTKSQNSIRSFYNQRIRWATKNKLMKARGLQMVMSIPYINSVLIIISFILSLIYSINILPLVLFHVFIKLIIDYLYLSELAEYYGIQKSMRYFAISEIFHILYLSGIGTLSLFVKKYNWKSRMVR